MNERINNCENKCTTLESTTVQRTSLKVRFVPIIFSSVEFVILKSATNSWILILLITQSQLYTITGLVHKEMSTHTTVNTDIHVIYNALVQCTILEF